MSLLNLLNNYKLIDFHVHEKYYKSIFQIVFPSLFIDEISCDNHIVRCDYTDGAKYRFVCTTCNKTIYYGEDPYVKYNKNLIFNKHKNQIVFPVIMVSPQIDKEIEYYEKKFNQRFIGFKLHPNFSEYKIQEVTTQKNRIFLFHSGIGEMENPNNIIKFAKNCPGCVIIAHLARFNKKVFDNIKNMDNVYLDCSSLKLLWNTYKNNRSRLFNTDYLGEFCSPLDMLQKCINYIGSEKILFASDAPYGSVKEDLAFIKGLDVNDYNDITYNNAKRLLVRYIKEYGYD